MAQRRMFSPEIVESDEFLTMPTSSQALYFHLGMNADDDGFIQPKILMRACGFAEDDLKILLAKRFLLAFDTGVVVIKHWLIHNLIRGDRYKPTRFVEEKKSLILKENKAYTEAVKLGCQNDNQMAPQVRLGKVRLGKDRESESVPEKIFKGEVTDSLETSGKSELVAEPEQEKTLAELVQPYEEKHGKEICTAFLLHWTQKNPNGKKELWQMQKVFDVPKRLSTWAGKPWNQPRQSKFAQSPEDTEYQKMKEAESKEYEEKYFQEKGFYPLR